MRTKWMDPDFRSVPKTERFCILCQKDLAPGAKHRIVHWEVDRYEAIHPDDLGGATVEIVERRGRTDAVQRGLVGMDCARRLGLEWTLRGEG